MKNGQDIQSEFAAKTKTTGRVGLYSCIVYIGKEMICEGIGSTFQMAEETAYYGTKISLNKK